LAAPFNRRRFSGLGQQGAAAGILALARCDGARVLGVDETALAMALAGQQQGVGGGALVAAAAADVAIGARNIRGQIRFLRKGI